MPSAAGLVRMIRWNICQQIVAQMFRSSLPDAELRRRAAVMLTSNLSPKKR